MILGTAAYMSPEQAKGKAVDRRADVWNFGCVLYECLTGRGAFPGATVSEILAEVIKGEPDSEALPPSTPPSVRRVIRRCLVKDPRDRLRVVVRPTAPAAQDHVAIGIAAGRHDPGDALLRHRQEMVLPGRRSDCVDRHLHLGLARLVIGREQVAVIVRHAALTHVAGTYLLAADDQRDPALF